MQSLAFRPQSRNPVLWARMWKRFPTTWTRAPFQNRTGKREKRDRSSSHMDQPWDKEGEKHRGGGPGNRPLSVLPVLTPTVPEHLALDTPCLCRVHPNAHFPSGCKEPPFLDTIIHGFRACGKRHVWGSNESSNCLRNMFVSANSELYGAKLRIPFTLHSRGSPGNLNRMAVLLNASNIFLYKLLSVQKLFMSDFTDTRPCLPGICQIIQSLPAWQIWCCPSIIFFINSACLQNLF